VVAAAGKPAGWAGENSWRVWLVAAPWLILCAPTLVELANQTWSRENGAQGPIILALGVWLLWRQAPELRRLARPGDAWIAMGLLAVALCAYVLGRMFDFITLEAGGLYGAGLAILYAQFGWRALLNGWFPLLYLAFTIPPPSWMLDAVTAPLKHLVSDVSTRGLSALGFPVAQEGVTIFVAQYQLLVEDACSGMNSIEGLIAVELLYVYLMRGSNLAYSLFLTALVIPVAILANVVRISAIVLITYFFGNEVGQSFIHMAAGLVLFSTSIVLIFAFDRVCYPLLARIRRSA
jgi:exosortase